MLSGQISRKSALNDIFKAHKEVIEVYSSLDFHLANVSAEFYILMSGKFNYSVMLQQLSQVYGPCNVSLYVNKDPMHSMFHGTKIIWRKGEWFL